MYPLKFPTKECPLEQKVKRETIAFCCRDSFFSMAAISPHFARATRHPKLVNGRKKNKKKIL